MNKLINFSAVLLWIFLASLRLRLSIESGSISPFLLAVVSGMIAYYLVVRNSSSKRIPVHQHVFSGLSVFAPMMIKITGRCSVWGEAFVIAGSLFTIWALINLRKSFGIAPADRGLVKSGPYRYIRHPMYAGEIITLFGASLGCFSIWNLIILFIISVTFYTRIMWEENIITGYKAYMNKVRWRLLPGVW